MAGRSRPAHVLRLGDQQPPLLGVAPPHPALIDDPRLLPQRSHHLLPPPPQSLLVEERLAGQHRDIQALLLDNQRLAATHVALKQELNASQHELRLMVAAAARTKAERDAEIRDLYERSLKMEADDRVVEGMRAEMAQVRSDVQKLGAVREELVERLQGLSGELARARADMGQASAIRAEIETMHHELQRGRAAVEFEKKAHADNLEQSQAMEKNMITIAREVEKLRAELANAEKRARAAAAANPGTGYAGNYGNPEIAYGGNSYAEAYAMHQAQMGANGGLQYGSGAPSHGVYDMQQSHVHR